MLILDTTAGQKFHRTVYSSFDYGRTNGTGLPPVALIDDTLRPRPPHQAADIEAIFDRDELACGNIMEIMAEQWHYGRMPAWARTAFAVVEHQPRRHAGPPANATQAERDSFY